MQYNTIQYSSIDSLKSMSQIYPKKKNKKEDIKSEKKKKKKRNKKKREERCSSTPESKAKLWCKTKQSLKTTNKDLLEKNLSDIDH